MEDIFSDQLTIEKIKKSVLGFCQNHLSHKRPLSVDYVMYNEETTQTSAS